MFISRNSKLNWKWYAKITTKDNGNNEFSDYIDFRFSKDCEPLQEDLNQYGSYEADLYLIDKEGRKRKVYPFVNYYNGNTKVEFRIMGIEGATPYDKGFVGNENNEKLNYHQDLLNDGDTDMFGRNIKVNDEELNEDDYPFY